MICVCAYFITRLMKRRVPPLNRITESSAFPDSDSLRREVTRLPHTCSVPLSSFSSSSASCSPSFFSLLQLQLSRGGSSGTVSELLSDGDERVHTAGTPSRKEHRELLFVGFPPFYFVLFSPRSTWTGSVGLFCDHGGRSFLSPG